MSTRNNKSTHQVLFRDRACAVGGARDSDLNVVRLYALLELALTLYHVLHACRAVPFHLTVHHKRRGQLQLGQAIRHEVKFTIRGGEHDITLLVKLSEAHALVELYIFHVDGAPGTTLTGKHCFVVQPELAFWHAREIGFHVELAADVGVHDGAVGIDQQVELLDAVQEHLQPVNIAEPKHRFVGCSFENTKKLCVRCSFENSKKPHL